MKRLGVALAALIVIAAVWFFQSKHEEKRISGKNIHNFLGLSRDDITALKITNAFDTFNLFLNNGLWYLIENTPLLADSTIIENILNASCSLTVGNVVSENPDRQLDFNVDDSSGIHVYFYDGDRLLSEIIVGKPAPDFKHTYVRRPGENFVYMTNKQITYTYGRQRHQWLSKHIIALDTARIIEMTFEYPKETFRVVRQDTLWMLSKIPSRDSHTANSAEIKVLLDLLKNLTASGFPAAEDSAQYDFAETDYTLKIALDDGSGHSLRFFKPNTEKPIRHFCQRDDYPLAFSIISGFYNMLRPDFDELKL